MSASKVVLVVEDESLIRDFEVAALKRAGFEVLAAGDGIDGSTLFARRFQEIDLLVTDISLPGMNGVDLATFARKIRGDLNVLFASGSIDAESRESAGSIAGSKFLAKPFTPRELLESIDELLSESQQITSPAGAASGPAVSLI
jgi:DNA-binding response OmpR family regulator